MFNLHRILADMTTTGWIILAICLLVWILATYLMGELSDKHWGDRESGALVGFFVPGIVFVVGLYML
ncbi:hypothetical protein [Endozoicomonas numazuensis]|uniref:Uncharacterized protein n=1 Tax=Endozoicomonas numazuensis TaxID=1137799 RepID=A0A081NJR6_9GAMM|nr:hypothetical protein [Endozoicomonas numazuensis]KEQ18689.1 hypothetical protein GZ78_00780 [Endozoicomonas numazuensis]